MAKGPSTSLKAKAKPQPPASQWSECISTNKCQRSDSKSSQNNNTEDSGNETSTDKQKCWKKQSQPVAAPPDAFDVSDASDDAPKTQSQKRWAAQSVSNEVEVLAPVNEETKSEEVEMDVCKPDKGKGREKGVGDPGTEWVSFISFLNVWKTINLE